MAAMREEMENIEHAEKTALDKVLGLEECVIVVLSHTLSSLAIPHTLARIRSFQLTVARLAKTTGCD